VTLEASRCQCGCTLTDTTGHIIASARQRCQSTVRRWTIHVHAHHTITLTVDYFTFSRASSLRVYDATTSTAATDALPLLLKLPEDGEDEDAARTAVTSGNRMLIEYVSADNDVSVVRSSDGFIASYIATDQLTGTATVTLSLQSYNSHVSTYSTCMLVHRLIYNSSI